LTKNHFKRLTKKHKDLIDDLIFYREINDFFPYAILRTDYSTIKKSKITEAAIKLLRDLEKMNLIDLDKKENFEYYEIYLKDQSYELSLLSSIPYLYK